MNARSPSHRGTAMVIALAAALLVLLLGVTPTAAMPAQAGVDVASVPTSAVSAGPEAGPPEAGASPVTEAPATGPRPVGREVPTRRQRILDNLVLVELLVVLFGGGAWWAWSSRRRTPG